MSPDRRLLALGGFFAGGIALSALYGATGRGLPCPFRLVTGWDCPFCGGTRLGAALLHGDVAAAFAYNPVLLIGLVLAGLVGVAWIAERLGGPRLRAPEALRASRLATTARRVTPTGWLLVGGGLAVVYTVLRNLL